MNLVIELNLLLEKINHYSIVSLAKSLNRQNKLQSPSQLLQPIQLITRLRILINLKRQTFKTYLGLATRSHLNLNLLINRIPNKLPNKHLLQKQELQLPIIKKQGRQQTRLSINCMQINNSSKSQSKQLQMEQVQQLKNSLE